MELHSFSSSIHWDEEQKSKDLTAHHTTFYWGKMLKGNRDPTEAQVKISIDFFFFLWDHGLISNCSNRALL